MMTGEGRTLARSESVPLDGALVDRARGCLLGSACGDALGGETDTTAAVAGALAGALDGANAIPERWRTTLQHLDELDGLAVRLMGFSAERVRSSHGS